MPIEELKSNYEAVLKDLFAQRAAHQRAIGERQRIIAELDQTIAGISKSYQLIAASDPHIGASAQNALPPPVAVRPPPTNQRFATISVRWGILYLLDENDGLSTAEITNALRSGGIRSKASNFANNVSAVLSN